MYHILTEVLMNHKYLCIIVAIAALFIADVALSQPWTYDFGTVTGSHTTGVSTAFLPAPPSGTARVRIGTGGGSFELENQVIEFGTDSYLRAVAATGTSWNKMSVYDYPASQVFTLRFTVRFGASDGSSLASSGGWYLFLGDGAMYSDNNGFTGAQVFTGLRWNFTNGDSTIITSYRNGTAWTSVTPLDTAFDQGETDTVEIYGNNSAAAFGYTYNGSQSVGANTFDLWVNGELIGDDLSKATLPGEANIDSWLFYGGSSAENAANIFLDDIIYTNDIADTPLPVQLSSFTGIRTDGGVMLSWSTLSEMNNYGFYVERKGQNEISYTTLAGSFVPGRGTTLDPQSYQFKDNTAAAGVWYYRLRQVDIGGAEHYSEPICIQSVTSVDESQPLGFTLAQNYPNPFNPATVISYQLPAAGNVRLVVLDMLGREVKVVDEGLRSAGTHSVEFDAVGLASGTYMYRLQAIDQVLTRQMLLLR